MLVWEIPAHESKHTHHSRLCDIRRFHNYCNLPECPAH